MNKMKGYLCSYIDANGILHKAALSYSEQEKALLDKTTAGVIELDGDNNPIKTSNLEPLRTQIKLSELTLIGYMD